MNKPNLAFIDGQNLHLGTLSTSLVLWMNRSKHSTVTYRKQGSLYSELKATKKGNVDTDIVFEAMRSLIDRNDFNKVILVSGDGDYKKLVDYLIEKGRFEKILFPNRKYAS